MRLSALFRNICPRTALAGALLGLTLLAACGPVALPPNLFETKAKSPPVPEGFFRVFADVCVRETGELIHINYVASCGAIVQSWKHTTSDVFFGMAPHIMLVPTGSGELIGVRTPEVCDNDYWTNWTEPKDYGPDSDSFLPLLMWYPDAANIGFAIGYLSDKAYESPYSKLDLIRSGIAKSNEAEWRAWREEAEAGYEEIGAMPGPWGHQIPGRIGSSKEDFARLRKLMGEKNIYTHICFSTGMIDVPDVGRARIEALLPDDERPWISMWDIEKPLANEIQTLISGLDFGGYSYREYRGGLSELGVRKSNGGGAFGDRDRANAVHHDRHPIVPYQPAEIDPETGFVTIWHHEILTDPNWIGFGFCGELSPSADDLSRYAAGQLDRLSFDYSTPLPEWYEDSKEETLEVLLVEGVEVSRWINRRAGGGIKSSYRPATYGRDGKLLPNCCKR